MIIPNPRNMKGRYNFVVPYHFERSSPRGLPFSVVKIISLAINRACRNCVGRVEVFLASDVKFRKQIIFFPMQESIPRRKRHVEPTERENHFQMHSVSSLSTEFRYYIRLKRLLAPQ